MTRFGFRDPNLVEVWNISDGNVTLAYWCMKECISVMTTPDICFVRKVRVRFHHLPVTHYVYYPHSNSWGCLHKKFGH
jgi:hypothetical protein